jgi:hypothetical protein
VRSLSAPIKLAGILLPEGALKMTAYEEFVNKPALKGGKLAILWELKVSNPIDDSIDFCRKFLQKKGYSYTGYMSETGKAVFNDRFTWDGAIQDGNKLALRICEI